MYLLIPRQGAVTPIGLMDKYMSTDAVRKCWTNGRSTLVQLKEGGDFGFVSAAKPAAVRVNGEAVEVADLAKGLYEVKCGTGSGDVLVEILHD
ncbi:hypothetical protein SD70_26830 [Gordoniibacillus kamchatkensis]|uniref:Uncharacterized protein n=1 Tax=Gordoniibacillus kamchatkensis TaxID=1590651 RepID=A0ABR5ABD1_9BACL|nr:hypothetical protein [Paenibacillus sp. VKM B-2647]KIL38349.1 hypothetical protein SD70_26830 [Paenibacillus sp. VKM B-2647]